MGKRKRSRAATVASDGKADDPDVDHRTRKRKGSRTEHVVEEEETQARNESDFHSEQAALEIDEDIGHLDVDIDEARVEEEADKLSRSNGKVKLTEREKALLAACGRSRLAKATLTRYLRLGEVVKKFCEQNELPVQWVNPEKSAHAAHIFLVTFLMRKAAPSSDEISQVPAYPCISSYTFHGRRIMSTSLLISQ
jgi:hypothetical protein